MTASRRPVRRRRRGAILLVVLALLALFAVIGLSFVLYAESAGTSSRFYREEKNNRDKQPPDAEGPAGATFGQLLYGPVDPQSGFNGVSLAQLAYGYDPSGGNDTMYNGVGLVHERLAVPAADGTAASTVLVNRAEVINFAVTRIGPGGSGPGAAPAVKVDAEHTFGTGDVRRSNGSYSPLDVNALKSMVFVPKNAPYTYPDRNNALVAAVDPATGRVIVPSGHRPSLFDANQTAAYGWTTPPGASQRNANWYSAAGRFRTLRVRPIEQVRTADLPSLIKDLTTNGIPWPVPDAGPTFPLAKVNLAAQIVAKYTAFPYPAVNVDGTSTGDVANLTYTQGYTRADSFWTDARLPTQEYRGRKVAPLVAPLVVPLNGRLDLNAVGNLVGGAQTSAGYGPQDINPAWLSELASAPLPPQAVLNGKQFPQVRFGGSAMTATPAAPSGQSVKPFQQATGAATVQQIPLPSYALVDWSGTAVTAPDYAPTGSQSVPTYPTYTLASTAANYHPSLWNAGQRGSFNTTDVNPDATTSTVPRGFPLTDLKLFAGKYSGKGAEYQRETFLANDRRRIAPPAGGFTAYQNEFLGNGSTSYYSGGSGPFSPGNRTRSLVTPFSSGFARPGLAPNYGMDSTVTAANPAPSLRLAAGSASPALANTSGPQLPNFLINANNQPAGPVGANMTGGVTVADTPLAGTPAYTAGRLAERAFTDSIPTASDQTLASNVFKRLAVNLRAALGGVDLNRPLADYRTDLTRPLTGATASGGADNAGNTTQAMQDRQTLARDIFLRLAVATGARIAYDPNVTTAQSYYAPYVLPQPTNTAGQYSLTLSTGTYAADTTLVTQADYDALRWLAQLAANIVDYIDTDDVSTVFVWNPSPNALFTDVANPPGQYAANLSSTTPVPSDTYTSPPLSQRAVFGTEKPGLVLNEVYAEIANQNSDAIKTSPNAAASSSFPVRFFVELLNPAQKEPDPAAGTVVHPNTKQYEANGTVIMNTRGAVGLHYSGVADDSRSAYRVVICDNGTTVRGELAQASNVRGDPVTTTTVKAIATLQDLTLGNPMEAANTSTQLVEPNNSQPSGAPGTQAGRNGFAVIGPSYTRSTNDVAFTPDPMTGNFQMLLQKPITGTTPTNNQNYGTSANNLMQYDATPTTGTGPALDQGQLNGWLSAVNAGTRKHAVLLQRLANPYIPFNANTNPYLTVDYLTRIEVQDGAKNLKAANTGRTPAAPALNTRFSLGRVQPFGGDEGDAQTPPLTDIAAGTTQNQSLTLRQTGNSGGAQTTFFSHNTPTPTAGKFEWLTQLDRRLVSPAELLMVGSTKPHELTHKFGVPQTGGGPLYHRHDLQHRRADLTNPASGTNAEGPLYATNGTSTQVASPLYRALELLAVKPWTHGVPYGGRQAGKVNVNMLWDENPNTGRSRVLDAVLDRSTANAFTDTPTTGDTAVIWTALKGSRSPGWAAGKASDGFNTGGVSTGGGWVSVTADEAGTYPPAATSDRPIKGFGAGLFQAGTYGPYVSVPAGGGLEDTLLRPRTVASAQPGTNDNRALFSASTSPGVHPMQDHEPLRKALNSLTTVSDTYVVILTVGFFEVLEESAATTTEPGVRVLGKEVYNEAAGDLRRKFMAVVDRTNLTTRGLTTGTFYNSLSTTGFTNSGDTTPWQAEVSNPNIGQGSFDTLRVTGPSAVAATTAPDTATGYTSGDWKRISNPTVPAGGAAKVTMSLDVTAEGFPNSIVAVWQRDAGGVITNIGTRFFIGSGETRELVEAYVDGSPGNEGTFWSFNTGTPATGTGTSEVKISVRRVNPATLVASGPLAVTHTGGEMLTNANFGNPGPQPTKSYTPGQSDAVVRMVAELKQ